MTKKESPFPEYTNKIGVAGESYFKELGFSWANMPFPFNWEDLWNIMNQEAYGILDERKEIREKRGLLSVQIQKAQDGLAALQKKCNHRFAVTSQDGVKGSWDASDDVSWDNYDCPDCGKSWREYHS